MASCLLLKGTNPLKFAAKWLWGVILTFRFSRLFVQHRLYRLKINSWKGSHNPRNQGLLNHGY